MGRGAGGAVNRCNTASDIRRFCVWHPYGICTDTARAGVRGWQGLFLERLRVAARDIADPDLIGNRG